MKIASPRAKRAPGSALLTVAVTVGRRLALVAAPLPTAALLAVLPGAALAAEPTYDFARYLNIRAATSPSFSPDGRSLVFQSNITGVNQVFRIPVEGGWPEQLTFLEDGVSGAAEYAAAAGKVYSPVAPDIVVRFARGGNERYQIARLSDDGEEWLAIDPDTSVIHNFGGWSPDGTLIAYSSNARDARHFDIYVADAKTGASRRVLQRDGTNSVAGWSPDGASLLVSCANTNLDRDLFLVDVATGDTVHLTPHTGTVQYEDPLFSADGKSLYLRCDLDREFLNLARLDIATRKIEFVEDVRWDLDLIALSDDGRVMVKGYNVDGFTELHVVEVGTWKELPAPGTPPGVISGVTFSRDGKKIAFTLSGPTLTPDVWTYDLGTRERVQVTRSTTAGIPRASFVEPEVVRFRSFDGIEVPGLLYLPEGAKKEDRLPTIVNVHGGPESQAQAYFSKITQYFVHRGYAVYYPNVRGSTGYGRTYTHLDDVRKRGDSVKDLAEAARWLAREGYSDPRKIAVMGGSYGGFMTLAALTSHPDLWAAGIDMVGIANFLTFLENTGAYRRHLRIAEYGDPEKDGAFLREISPLSHVERIRAPLLVIQGANDPRVPPSEAEQIVEAVRSRGGVVEYILFEDEGHGVSKIPNQIEAYTRAGDFLDAHVGPRVTPKAER